MNRQLFFISISVFEENKDTRFEQGLGWGTMMWGSFWDLVVGICKSRVRACKLAHYCAAYNPHQYSWLADNLHSIIKQASTTADLGGLKRKTVQLSMEQRNTNCNNTM